MQAMPSNRQFRNPSSLLLTLATLMLPGLSLAWGGYNNVNILQLTLYQAPADVGALVKFSPATPNLEGCTYKTGDTAWIDTTTADGKGVYASLLAAQLAGHSVDVGVHGCVAGGYPRVYGITVHQ
jgi:hypothetical protein